MDLQLNGSRSSPLIGKKIFMHYEHGSRPNKHTERILVLLKGEIVQFFDRNIDYVVTNVPSSRLPNPVPVLDITRIPKENIDPRSPPVPLPLSASMATPLQRLKELNAQSANGIGKVPVLARGNGTVNVNVLATGTTRGRAMLLAVSKASFSGAAPLVSGMRPTVSAILPQNPSTFEREPIAKKKVVKEKKMPDGDGKSISPTSRDLLTKARQLGIKILTIETVAKWIKHLPEDIQQHIQAGESPFYDQFENESTVEDPDRDRISGVRAFAKPCVKVIEMGGKFKPLYMERTNYLSSLWQIVLPPETKTSLASTYTTTRALETTAEGVSTPHASLGCNNQNPTSMSTTANQRSTNLPATGTSVRTVNFPPTRPSKRNISRRHGAAVVSNFTVKQHPSTPGKRHKFSRNMIKSKYAAEHTAEPSGYCECCAVSYMNLFEHVYGKDHSQFAENPENFRHLDELLGQIPTFAQVVVSATQVLSARQAVSPDVDPGNLFDSPTEPPFCNKRRNNSSLSSASVNANLFGSPTLASAGSIGNRKRSASLVVKDASLPLSATRPLSVDDPSAAHEKTLEEVSVTEAAAMLQRTSKPVAMMTGPDANLFTDPSSGDNQIGLANDLILATTASASHPPACSVESVLHEMDQSFSPPSAFEDVRDQVAEAEKIIIPPPNAFADSGQSMAFLSSPAPSPVFAFDHDGEAEKLSVYPEDEVMIVEPLLITPASLLHAPIAVEEPGLPPPPLPSPRTTQRLAEWRRALDCISIISPVKQTEVGLPKVSTLSPILQQLHTRCSHCHRLHIPTNVPLHLKMKLSMLFSAQATCDGLGCAPSPYLLPILLSDDAPAFEASEGLIAPDESRLPILHRTRIESNLLPFAASDGDDDEEPVPSPNAARNLSPYQLIDTMEVVSISPVQPHCLTFEASVEPCVEVQIDPCISALTGVANVSTESHLDLIASSRRLLHTPVDPVILPVLLGQQSQEIVEVSDLDHPDPTSLHVDLCAAPCLPHLDQDMPIVVSDCIQGEKGSCGFVMPPNDLAEASVTEGNSSRVFCQDQLVPPEQQKDSNSDKGLVVNWDATQLLVVSGSLNNEIETMTNAQVAGHLLNDQIDDLSKNIPEKKSNCSAILDTIQNKKNKIPVDSSKNEVSGYVDLDIIVTSKPISTQNEELNKSPAPSINAKKVSLSSKPLAFACSKYLSPSLTKSLFHNETAPSLNALTKSKHLLSQSSSDKSTPPVSQQLIQSEKLDKSPVPNIDVGVVQLSSKPLAFASSEYLSPTLTKSPFRDETEPSLNSLTKSKHLLSQSSSDKSTPPVSQQLIQSEELDKSPVPNIDAGVVQLSSKPLAFASSEYLSPTLTKSPFHDETVPSLNALTKSKHFLSQSSSDKSTSPVSQQLIQNEELNKSPAPSINAKEVSLSSKPLAFACSKYLSPSLTKSLFHNETAPSLNALTKSKHLLSQSSDKSTPPVSQQLIQSEELDKSPVPNIDAGVVQLSSKPLAFASSEYLYPTLTKSPFRDETEPSLNSLTKLKHRLSQSSSDESTPPAIALTASMAISPCFQPVQFSPLFCETANEEPKTSPMRFIRNSTSSEASTARMSADNDDDEDLSSEKHSRISSGALESTLVDEEFDLLRHAASPDRHPMKERNVQQQQPVYPFPQCRTPAASERVHSRRRAATVARQGISLGTAALYTPTKFASNNYHHHPREDDESFASDWSVDSTANSLNDGLGKLVFRRIHKNKSNYAVTVDGSIPSSSSTVSRLEQSCPSLLSPTNHQKRKARQRVRSHCKSTEKHQVEEMRTTQLLQGQKRRKRRRSHAISFSETVTENLIQQNKYPHFNRPLAEQLESSFSQIEKNESRTKKSRNRRRRRTLEVVGDSDVSLSNDCDREEDDKPASRRLGGRIVSNEGIAKRKRTSAHHDSRCCSSEADPLPVTVLSIDLNDVSALSSQRTTSLTSSSRKRTRCITGEDKILRSLPKCPRHSSKCHANS